MLLKTNVKLANSRFSCQNIVSAILFIFCPVVWSSFNKQYSSKSSTADAKAHVPILLP